MAGVPDAEAIERLRKGNCADGRRTLPADVKLLTRGRADRDSLVVITIREGRNRQVRRMCEAVGHPVRALIRTRIGPISDKRLKAGMWRDLAADEIRALKEIRKWKSERRKAGKVRFEVRHNTSDLLFHFLHFFHFSTCASLVVAER